MSKSVGPRAWLLRILTPAACVVLATLLGLPLLLGRPTVPVASASATAGGTGGASALEAPHLEDLRSLPVLDPAGFVRSAFPEGEGLDNPNEVRAAADEIASTIGISEVMPEVWSALANGYDYGGSGALTDATSYPYTYGSLQGLGATITSELVDAHYSEVMDLAGLFLLAGANSDFSDPAMHWGAAAAFVIYSAVAEARPDDCDATLSIAFTVGLGDSPRADVVDDVFGRAVDACPDDPTPRWVWGHRWVEESGWQEAYRLDPTLSRAEVFDRAIDFFRAWVDESPNSPLPHAGLADALMAEAESLSLARVMPFTVRARATEAATEYVRAASLSPDSAFELGAARADSLSGEDDEAADHLDAVNLSGSAVVQQAASTVWETIGRFGDAAAAVSEPAPALDRSRVVFLNMNHDFQSVLGSLQSRQTFVTDATMGEYGGGFVDWLGFIPDYRYDSLLAPYARTAACRPLTAMRNRVLAHDYDPLQADYVEVEGAPGCTPSLDNHDVALLQAVAADDLGDVDTRDSLITTASYNGDYYGYLDTFYEAAQNFWRYGGELDAAAAVLTSWVDDVGSSQAYQRAGEVAFLSDDFDAAVEAFEVAIERYEYPIDEYSESDGVYELLLMHGLALEKAGDTDEALAAYEQAASDPSESAWAAAAEARIGAIEVTVGNVEDAIPALERAAAISAAHDDLTAREVGFADPLDKSRPISSGADYNNLAVALLDLGRETDRAVELAERAVTLDRESPVFQDTLGQALQKAGRAEEAEPVLKDTAADDSTTYQTSNNLGVLRGEQGKHDAALAALRSAVSAKPDYAIGWFNLGVELGRGGPGEFLSSQRALAEAVHLDSSYRGAPLESIVDTSAVVTGLDISRPVSPGWTFASAASTPVQGFSVMVLLLALVGLARNLGADAVLERVAGRLLNPRWRGHRFVRGYHSVLGRFTPLWFALAVAASIAAWPFLAGGAGWVADVVTLAGVASVLWLYVALSRRVGGSAPERHRGWGPAMAFGGVTAVFGLAFVPVPVNDDAATGVRARWAGCAVLGAVACTGLLVGLVTDVPIARTLGIAGLAMLTTALFPLRPFDGGFITEGKLSRVVSVTVLAASTALVLGWI